MREALGLFLFAVVMLGGAWILGCFLTLFGIPLGAVILSLFGVA